MFYIHNLGAPESCEVADLDESMSRLMFSSSSSKKDSSSSSFLNASVPASTFSSAPALLSLLVLVGSGMISEDSINQMDQFLREALQNPRERLSSELPRSRLNHHETFAVNDDVDDDDEMIELLSDVCGPIPNRDATSETTNVETKNFDELLGTNLPSCMYDAKKMLRDLGLGHTASDMRWHKEKRVDDGVLRHPADAEAWKSFDRMYPSFNSESRNVRLGPHSPGKEIDVYLRPLIDELKELWHDGIETYDVSIGQYFKMYATILWTINDFPAYGMLSGWSTKGYMACPVCNVDTSSQSLRSKICYMGHRRYMPTNHPWRKSRLHDEHDIVLILCKLERIFPPAFFDVMVHLLVHLPHEAKLAGPVGLRWIYPIERILSTYKSYVRNKAYPEGSIAEAYNVNESLTFCSQYLLGIETKFNRPDRNVDDLNDQSNGFSVFSQRARPFGSYQQLEFSRAEIEKTHWCINVDNKWYEEDPYVLASQAQQIFYVNDPKLGSSWKVVQKVLHRHIFDVPEQTTTNDSENDNEDPTIEEAYQENDSTDIVWSVNQDCNVLQYQRVDGDPSYIDIENVVDHGRRFENDDLTAFINDQDEEDETFVDYCSEDNENSDEEDHDSDSDSDSDN
ncbi:hypothetical protein CK203_018034 [Vitis vinifera]|uniref:DUF4218 domain-containing protein n=1 Tax=Vitis vinifera TaxID=29760 RepID=A0A438JWC3_VITVI|nr:hypothetical protein CK203_018034 [Vitis vinifera]